MWLWEISFWICLFVIKFSLLSNWKWFIVLFLLLILFLFVIEDFNKEAWFFNLLITSLLLFNEYLVSFLFWGITSILYSEILINFSLFFGDDTPLLLVLLLVILLPILLKVFFNLWPFDEFNPVEIPLFLLLFILLLFALSLELDSLIFFLWYKLSSLKVFWTLLLGGFLPIEFPFFKVESLSFSPFILFLFPTIFTLLETLEHFLWKDLNPLNCALFLIELVISFPNLRFDSLNFNFFFGILFGFNSIASFLFARRYNWGTIPFDLFLLRLFAIFSILLIVLNLFKFKI